MKESTLPAPVPENTDASCLICSRQSTVDRFRIYEDDHWVLRHSSETDIVGYLILEARRHFLDLADACEQEARTYGPMMRVVMLAQRQVITPYRIYTFTLAEKVPHFHVHLIPRTDSLPRAYHGRGILSYPLDPPLSTALVDSVCTRLQKELRRQLLLTR